MKTQILLSDEKAEKVADGVATVAKALREAGMPFVAAQLQPNEKVVDMDGLTALETRLGAAERLMKLRPAEKPNQQKTIDFAVGVLKKRVTDAKGNGQF